jgi:hypothetical protein
MQEGDRPIRKNVALISPDESTRFRNANVSGHWCIKEGDYVQTTRSEMT